VPSRIQLRRTKGWRKPADTVSVARPTRFGNPFSVGEHGREKAIAMFAAWIQRPEQKPLLDEALVTLGGKNLACWCRPGELCHADVLLRLVNA
jgi:Domain of unknown function (DUF4326)